MSAPPGDGDAGRVRLDKWLWAARFLKTRALASQQIERGRVSVNGQPAKPARELRVGDRIVLRLEGSERTIEVLALSRMRGPAPVAQQLYRETPESIAAREAAARERRLAPEPAAAHQQGRPTKGDRRHIVDWQRWSVSLDDAGDDPA